MRLKKIALYLLQPEKDYRIIKSKPIYLKEAPKAELYGQMLSFN